MAAPNQQPTGSRPGPGQVHTHSPHEGGKPKAGSENKGWQGVAPHGTPKPIGNGKANPLR